jgi:hypothetical protein
MRLCISVKPGNTNMTGQVVLFLAPVMIGCLFAMGVVSAGTMENPGQEEVMMTAPPSPLTIVLEGPVNVNRASTVLLSVTISRTPAILQTPIDLTIALPEGVHLVSGALEENVSAESSTEVVREYVIEIGEIPLDDVVVTANIVQPSWGVYATAKYRFGRPEPKLPQPVRQGRELKVQGRSLGVPIPID